MKSTLPPLPVAKPAPPPPPPPKQPDLNSLKALLAQAEAQSAPPEPEPEVEEDPLAALLGGGSTSKSSSSLGGLAGLLSGLGGEPEEDTSTNQFQTPSFLAAAVTPPPSAPAIDDGLPAGMDASILSSLLGGAL